MTREDKQIVCGFIDSTAWNDDISFNLNEEVRI